MKKIIAFIFLLCLALPQCMAAESGSIQIYVNSDAETTGDGSAASPFKTIEEAKSAVRKINKNMSADIYVNISGKKEFLNSTFKLDDRDSGHNGYNVIYRGIGEEKPVLSGGRTVDGWELYDEEKNIYRAPAKGLVAEQIYVNGRRAILARSEGTLLGAVADNGEFGYTCDDKSLLKYKHINDLNFEYKSVWTNPKLRVKSVKERDGKVLVEMPQPEWKTGRNRGQTAINLPWYMENALELLDAENEFYIDKYDDFVYYKPVSGENIYESEIIIPYLEEVVHIEGRNVERRAENIRFENLHFSHTVWYEPIKRSAWLSDQNNQGVSGLKWHPGVFNVLKGKNICIEDCLFDNAGAVGVVMLQGINNCSFIGNEITETASNAVIIGALAGSNGAANPKDKRYIVDGMNFNNNSIHDVVTKYKSAAAITLGVVANSEFSHNEIGRMPYSGFSVQWGWGVVTESASKNLVITKNYIYDCMSELHDGGCVYSLGGSGGTKENPNLITENYFKDQHSGTSVMYADNGSTGYLYKNNVVDFTNSKSKCYYAFLNDLGKNVYFEDNFSTFDSWALNSKEAHVTGTAVCPDANWPPMALEIIKNAGLEDKYKHLSRDKIEFDNIVTTDVSTIKVGESFNLNARARDRKGNDLNAEKIEYAVSNSTIVTVDQTGCVKAKAVGIATIYIQADYQGKSITKSKKIYVGDEPDGVTKDAGFSSYMLKGASREIKFSGHTKLGNTFELKDAYIRSDNPDILEVGGDNTLIGKDYGKATVHIGGKYKGRIIDEQHEFNVVDYGSSEAENIEFHDAAEITASPNKWQLNGDARISKSGDGLNLTVPGTGGTAAYYIGKKYENEILEFNMNMSDYSTGWNSIAFRVQDETKQLDGTFYLVTIKNNCAELQRFVNGKRTVIFGNFKAENIGGPQLDKTIVRTGIDTKIQIGAINTEDGVRIILNVNGKNVFDFIDDTEDRIEEAGYIGFMAQGGAGVNISPSK